MEIKTEKLTFDNNGIQKYIQKDDLEILIEYKKEIKNFKNKVNKHINYLKILMFIVIVYLSEINFFNGKQVFCVSFLLLFNIAFSQNIINNVPKIKN